MDRVQREYQKDEALKVEEVQKIQDWLRSQPHLPKMTEQEIIWFLKSCYYSNEAAKIALDNFFTMKTLSPEILRNKDFNNYRFQETMDVISISVLPEKTPEGHTVVIGKFVNTNLECFSFNESVKLFDLVIMLDIFENGTHAGFRLCFDMTGMTFGHVAKIGIVSMKKFLYYLQEGMPIRLKGLHFLNTTAVMEMLLQLMKPFLKKEVIEVLHLHETKYEMEKFIPVSCLPSDYGGNCDSFAALHDNVKQNILKNIDFINHQDSQVVDESKRPGKPKNVNDIFGVDGTFKKLDLD